jgi:hypothetical protein
MSLVVGIHPFSDKKAGYGGSRVCREDSLVNVDLIAGVHCDYRLRAIARYHQRRNKLIWTLHSKGVAIARPSYVRDVVEGFELRASPL